MEEQQTSNFFVDFTLGPVAIIHDKREIEPNITEMINHFCIPISFVPITNFKEAPVYPAIIKAHPNCIGVIISIHYL